MESRESNLPDAQRRSAAHDGHRTERLGRGQTRRRGNVHYARHRRRRVQFHGANFEQRHRFMRTRSGAEISKWDGGQSTVATEGRDGGGERDTLARLVAVA